MITQTGFDLIEPAATLVAVLLGAALTYFSTWFFEKRKNHAEQRNRAWSLFFVVQDMANDLVQLNAHTQESIKRAESHGVKGEAWTKIGDMIGFSTQEKHISTDQLVILAATKNAELLIRVREIESAHQIYMQVAQKLGQLRERLESFELQTSAEGSLVAFEADEKQFAKIAPLLIRLKDLGDALANRLPNAARKTMQTAEELGPHLKDHYKFKHFSKVTFPRET